MNIRPSVYIGGALLASLGLVCSSGFTQQVSNSNELNSGFVHKLPPGGPAPRTADGHPDLSGVWFPNGAGIDVELLQHVDPDARRLFDPKLTPEEKPSLQPSVVAKIKSLGDALRVQGGPN